MKYRYIDGRDFEAENAKELCIKLWLGQAFQLHHSVEDWMKENAKVVRNFTGKECSAASFEAHVNSLMQLGIIRRICPICGIGFSEHPAISRKDNKTEICPRCGMKEALDDWQSATK